MSAEQERGIDPERGESRPKPRPGERYRHFKNRLYQIIAVAVHSETGEELVIYQALYGSFGIYARPLQMFMSPVDRRKYPDAEQYWRFARVTEAGAEDARPEGADEACRSAGQEAEQIAEQSGGEELNPMVGEFLDAESTEERLIILRRMQGVVGHAEAELLLAALDLKPEPGSVGQQLDAIRQYLEMQERFDAPRMRRGTELG